MEAWKRTDGVRQKQFLGFDWLFTLTDSAETPGEGAAWRRVQLPHDWSAEECVDRDAPSCGSGGYARTGIGWYKRAFRLDASAERRTALLFDGVYMNCDVFVNGGYAGGHRYGYTPFELDISALVRDGENTVLVRVDNSRQPGSRWYSGSGITRDVWLLRTGKTRIATWGVCVRCDDISKEQSRVSVETKTLCEGEGRPVRAAVELRYAGRVCARAEGKPFSAGQTDRQSLTLPAPKLWSPDTPEMYTAIVSLLDRDTLLDEERVPFGVRALAYTPEDGLLLNCKKLLLRGVCLHHDGGCVGAAVPPEIWRRRLQRL